MNDKGIRTTRVTGLVAVMMAFLLLGVPSAMVGNFGNGLEIADKASAQPLDRIFTVGWLGFQGDVSTLNPFLYTMAAEMFVAWPCYMTLLQNEFYALGETSDIEGYLADNFTISSDGLTFEFELYRNGYWCDPFDPTAKVHPVTAEDVIWTYWQVNNYSKNHLHYYFPFVIDDMGLIDNDPYKFYMTTLYPYAPLLNALTGIPILPKYYWSTVDPLKHDGLPLIGCGQFYYPSETKPTSEARLHRSPQWMLEDTRGWQSHATQLVIKSESDNELAMIELEEGIIDCFIGVAPAVYVSEVMPGNIPNVIGFAQSTGFVYEFNANQMTDEMREELGGGFMHGSNSQLLQNLTIRKAMAMCIDKDAFISDVLEGLGTIATSLVPDVSPWYYEYGGPRAPPGEEQIAFNPAAARQMLMDAGWAYDRNGDPALIDTVPLCKRDPVTGDAIDDLSFRFCSLIPDVEWEEGATLIHDWMDQGGILLHGHDGEDEPFTLYTSSQINNIWYIADYDTWLWDWMFTPLSDPSTDVLSVCTTAEIGSWSDLYYSNTTYDALYNQSLAAVDPATRMEILDKLQRMLYEEYACQCISFRKELYGLNTEEWTNYGNWERSWMLMPDQYLPWLYMQFYPVDNHAPTVQVAETFEADINVAEDFYVTASDDSSNIEYRWFWGDGTKTGWSSALSSASHTYTKDGIYTAYVAAREVDNTEDYFITWNRTEVTVRDWSNDPPGGLSFVPVPDDPDTGTVVTFTGSATDPEGDELFFTWVFGDGYTGAGQVVEHQFTTEDSYTVTMYVDDHRIGAPGTRPVSTQGLISVTGNGPPSLDVIDYQEAIWKVPWTFGVTGSDPNPRDVLRYTWHWGDGTTTVTDGPIASHTYTQKLAFTLTVCLDDLTGLPGHNVSDTGTVRVLADVNAPPLITEFSVTNPSPYAHETVTFTGQALDNNGDALRFTFLFGDGTAAVFNSPVSDPGTLVTFEVDHDYATSGTKTAYVYVDDGEVGGNVSSSPLVLTVQANDPPVIYPALSDLKGTPGVQYMFTASATDPNDDPLTYTWHFGDGTPDAVGQTVYHTYTARGTYTFTVTVEDGKGGVDWDDATATINAIPVLTPISDRTLYATWTYWFNASATDADGDTLTYTWNFGDGTVLVGKNVQHAYNPAVPPTDYTVTLYCDDGFGITGHNVSDTAVMHVVEYTGVNSPPEVDPLDDVTGTVDEPISFYATATDPDEDDLTFTWEFGDGDWAVGQSVMHTYTSVDVFTVTVHVYDDSGIPENNVSVSATVTVLADQPPVADAGEDDEVDEDEPYTFSGAGSSDDVGIIDYTWTVIELSLELDHEVAPSYIFLEPGVYHVQLVVTDTIGQDSEPDEMVLTVNDITPPVADAGPDQDTEPGLEVTFDGSGSTDNVDVVDYSWVFFDGTVKTLSGVNPVYTFTAFGEYGVTLMVSDAAGNEDTNTVLITVTDLTPPVADAGEDQAADVDAEVTLDGSGTTDNYDEYLTYTWTMDEGATVLGTGVTIVYTFDTPGTYVVTLTVEDYGGNTDTDEVTITVTGEVEDTTAPVADAGVDQSVAVGATVTFDGSDSTDDSGAIDNYTWTFEYDGATRTLYDVDPTWTFDIAGEYTVTLNVTDAAGNYDTDTMVVTVEAANVPPVANAGPDATITVGETHDFSGAGSSDSDGSIANYTWTFTYDGATRTLYGATPSWTFDIEGAYVVTLTVTDDDGDTGTDTVTITVEAEEEEEEEDEEPGFPLALVAGGIIALIAILLAALLLMKRRKKGAAEEAPSAEESPPSEE